MQEYTVNQKQLLAWKDFGEPFKFHKQIKN